ncbi:sodium-coupled monocarboxylate transporter 1-like [Zophobas morio]|uniref:sodium-coupled monocarboxylate transporter 1-like n=1 Tax=Zophobas morio TaxID=2755281 RepID=UPI003083AB90
MVMPADVYKYGAFQWFACISMFLLVILSVYIYFPVFFNLQLTSAYEYLERRFDKKTKFLASTLYLVCELIFLAVAAYTPSLALSISTGINVHLISSTICAICVFYTAIGGLKTVVWTDFFQFGVIIVTLLIVSVVGSISSGGFLSIWKQALKGDRLNIFDLDPNPTKRDSFWGYLFGFTAHYTNYVSLTQSGLQKFLALPTFRESVWSVIYVGICLSIVYTFIVFIGLLMYAKYSKCDPFLSRKIQRHEQMVPYYIMNVAGHVPGISGCFLVALFCASLSTISSSLNAIAGVFYKDFLYRFLSKNIKEKTVTNILKLIVALCGIAIIGLVSIMQHLGDIAPLAASIAAMSHGPSMGMFTLGVLFPKANAEGAFYGAIGGFIFTASIAIPLKFYNLEKTFAYPSKPLSVESCSVSNQTTEFDFQQLNNSLVHSSTSSSYLAPKSKPIENNVGTGLYQISQIREKCKIS